jgi:predicted metal-dependent enzyme (double-stranded beta helix superfamily)
MPEMDDNTGGEIERLNQLTDDVVNVFKMITSASVIEVYKKVKELLIALDVRGIMTMLGMRTSPGSQNTVWPKRSALLEALNKKYK